MAYNTYYPEMGEKEPQQSDGDARLAHYGKHYFVDTKLDLKGRGIVFLKTLTSSDLVPQAQHKIGVHCYKVTVNAFDKLCAQYNFSGEILL